MGMYDPVGFVDGASALTAGDKAAIVGNNAAQLLEITDRVAESSGDNSN